MSFPNYTEAKQASQKANGNYYEEKRGKKSNNILKKMQGNTQFESCLQRAIMQRQKARERLYYSENKGRWVVSTS